MIAKGYTIEGATRTAVESKLKRTLHPDVYGLSMQGHRMLIGLDKAEEMHKGVLHKPRQAIQTEQMTQSSGWVVSVGPMVGSPGAPHPVGMLCEHPSDALGKHVYFQHHAGKVFTTSEDEDEWGSKDSLIILTDRDIQAVEDK